MNFHRLSVVLPWPKYFALALTVLVILPFTSPLAVGQQTLGSLNGTVTDGSGAVVEKATVKIRNLATNLEVTAVSKSDGSFSAADLPIGTYEVTFTRDGFKTAVYDKILMQGNRTTTVNAKLQPGAVATTVTVEATPLLTATLLTISKSRRSRWAPGASLKRRF
jgi:Carboxypeptidase regulatory-like domain